MPAEIRKKGQYLITSIQNDHGNAPEVLKNNTMPIVTSVKAPVILSS
jgi:hypothetical protein